MCWRLSINFPAEYILDHSSRFRVDDQQIFVVWGPHISIDNLAAHKLTIPALRFQVASHLNGNIPAIGVVHQIFERQDQLIVRRPRLGVVVIVVDCDKSDPKRGKQLLNIGSGVNILPAKAGKVFHNNTVYLTSLDRFDHLLKIRTVKVGASIAVVTIFPDKCDFRALFEKVHNHQSLV